MPEELKQLVKTLQSDFKEWELPGLLLTELQTEAPVSMKVLCDIARKGLPPQIDFDVKPLVRQAVSMLRAASALQFARGKNLGYAPVWSDNGQTLSWRDDKEYLSDLARDAGLASLL